MKRLALAALAALSACKITADAELFTSDLVAAMNGNAVAAPVQIGIEAPTADKCEEHADALTNAIRGQFADAQFLGCQSANFETLARFRVMAAIIAHDGTAPTPPAPLAIGVAQDSDAISVTMLQNAGGFRKIWNDLPQELTEYQTFDPQFRLSATLNNDLGDDAAAQTVEVFADGKPAPGKTFFTLARRDQITLKLSDVTNAAFSDSATPALILRLTAPAE